MGLFDKVKGMTGKGNDSVDVDKAKDVAGGVKDKTDDLADQHSEKIPDSVEGTYNKASDAAEKIIPGDDAKGG